MTRKKTLLCVMVLVLTATGSLLIVKSHSSEKIPSKALPVLKDAMASNLLITHPSQNPTASVIEAQKSVTPWDAYAPLSDNEKMEFESVEAQIQKFLTWGRMDEEAVDGFRQTLFKFGERAIGDVARYLSTLTKDDIKDRSEAENVIRKVDELAYFARSDSPMAHDSIRFLAERPVIWNVDGHFANPIEANVTFETFDIFALHHPADALEFIKGIEKNHRAAYFTHFGYGRRLAGKSPEQIDQELSAMFGSPEMALK